jgi:hypothetical protein
MINRLGQQRANALESRTAAELQAIAQALRSRVAADTNDRTELSREIARIEQLIALRRSRAHQRERRNAAR